MALATRCPNCHALFRVGADQLKLRGGRVRCGACHRVFDATSTLSYIDDAVLSTACAPDGASAVESEGLPPGHEPGRGQSEDADERIEDLARPPTTAHALATAAGDESGAAIAASVVATAAAIEPQAASEAEDQAAEPAGAAREETQPAPPAFLARDSQPARRGFPLVYAFGAALLALLLLAQIATIYRAEILVQFPAARPALTQLCRTFQCVVNWPARGELLAVMGTELQQLPGTSALELTAVVRNRGSFTLALPAIEVTLTDTQNRTVARKVFAPVDYLAGERDPSAAMAAGLEAGADLTIRIPFESRGLNAAGFVVYPFYL